MLRWIIGWRSLLKEADWMDKRRSGGGMVGGGRGRFGFGETRGVGRG